MFLSVDDIFVLTGLKEPDIRLLCDLVVCRPITAVRRRDLLPLLVYDILEKMGFAERARTAIVRHFRGQLLCVGKVYTEAKPGDKLTLMTLNVFDNHYAAVSTEPDNIFDFKKMESVQQFPMPTVSLALALPKLFERALEALPEPSYQRSEVEDRQESGSD